MRDTIAILIVVLAIVWSIVSVRVGLQRLQQSSYRSERYIRRLFGKDTALFFKDFRHVQLFIALGLSALLLFAADWLLIVTGCTTLLGLGFLLRSTRAVVVNEKKPFVFTQRATRLAVSCAVFALLPPLLFLIYCSSTTAAAFSVVWAVLVPVVLIAANSVNFPLEKQVNDYYLRDATRRRRELTDLQVIGITGSYGKTSTKHFVHALLARRYISYMTPGSVNTELGLAREIRERLRPIHEFFIAEMGARELGDIRACAEVVQPTWGILTCIGKAHLETFGSQEGIMQTKGELLQSIAPGGICFLNADDPHTEGMMKYVKSDVRLFGLHPSSTSQSEVDVFARDIVVTQEGSSFWVDGRKVSEPFEVKSQLLGRHNISNLICAISVALEAKVPVAVIQAAVRTLPPVEHRLQLLKKGNGILVIDDAFNSNPEGFREALDTLALFSDRRRVLVTPGMVELGVEEVRENRSIGKYAAARVDHVVLVGAEKRIAPLRDGLLENGFLAENIEMVGSLNQARQHLTQFNRPGDVVLFENDLPDIYG
ncbi:MAG: UDP-N-acetylmuramoyl-tripeptide--D-alanyl-D-alanine ligase [Bdellovibrionales bacterium]|nr:UDP-N-acetylmuramoyl-tripeptide--D-alanyl-D-alanine ligase [Bdellovibrionales bacterium]